MADDPAPTADEIIITAKIAGLPVSPEVAARIAISIGPGFRGFSAIAGTLPFDLEPATFITVQNGAGK
ncbi:hypothetical protein [Bradyrhizobium prioriisuperbiae]|uniref:hypothetical protein n=1 Tax=Bradyrhizobium prioriisuperbiae TaxID=2854389 RepID=UPI0028E69497|nr:hypothetical protein [Bradyrhizobium prioritasuperba]